MLEYGEGRGFVNSNRELKIHFEQESFWIKVIAVNNDKTKVIGVLMNNLLDTDIYIWGTIVMAEEINPNELFEMKGIVGEITNSSDWSLL